MLWPLSSGCLFHPPSLLTALHPSISTHVDETEINEDIPDGQPFHSITPNEFWLPWPTLLCRRLILTHAAFPPWQLCVLRGQNWVYLAKSGETSLWDILTCRISHIQRYPLLRAKYCKVEIWQPSSNLHNSTVLCMWKSVIVCFEG